MTKTEESLHLALFHASLTARHMRDVLAGSIGDVGLEAIAIQAEYVRENIAAQVQSSGASARMKCVGTHGDGANSIGGTGSELHSSVASFVAEQYVTRPRECRD